MTPDAAAVSSVLSECKRLLAKWGEQNHGDADWLAILAEEVGEVAECVCKTAVHPKDRGNLKLWSARMDREIAQVAAVAITWLECRLRRRVAEAIGRTK